MEEALDMEFKDSSTEETGMKDEVGQQEGGTPRRASRVIGAKRAKPRREVPDVQAKGEIIKVNIDLSETMLSELDQVAILLNVSRQSVIKNFIKDGLDRHFMGQKARS